jgi:hypothetical protein
MSFVKTPPQESHPPTGSVPPSPGRAAETEAPPPVDQPPEVVYAKSEGSSPRANAPPLQAIITKSDLKEVRNVNLRYLSRWGD